MLEIRPTSRYVYLEVKNYRKWFPRKCYAFELYSLIMPRNTKSHFPIPIIDHLFIRPFRLTIELISLLYSSDAADKFVGPT